MERLEIRNFLTIKEADIDVKRFTVLIGPQASGKSVVAKLLYFFREFLNTQFVRSIENDETKRELQKAGLKRFQELFPSYSWEKFEFFLKYTHDDVEVFISRKNPTGKRTVLSLSFSKNLDKLQRHAKESYLEMRKMAVMGKQEYRLSLDFKKKHIDSSCLEYAFRSSVFIPANRSFFAMLQKNIFSFLASNIDIDPLIKEFGSVYELNKLGYLFRGNSDDLSFLLRKVEKIIAGEYSPDNDGDWIISTQGRINISHASSGQQESLPMLITLLEMSSYAKEIKTFFIEEPEAHLFPTAQRHVVEFLASLYNLTGCNYFITTHSPYILTALNNLIYAGNLAQQESLREQVKEIVPEEIQVSFDDVSAYVMENGGIKSILDPELKIIGASVIDEVSNDFDAVFSKLLELEAAHG